MTNTNTYVVFNTGRGKWHVGDNNDILFVDGPYNNYKPAYDAARVRGAANGSDVILLTPINKGRTVALHVTPRIVGPRTPKDVNDVAGDIGTVGDTELETETVQPEYVDAELETEAETEESLNALPTAALVAVWNAKGGSITGKFKGARKALVAKILAAYTTIGIATRGFYSPFSFVQ